MRRGALRFLLTRLFLLFLVFLFFFSNNLFSQNTINGKVTGRDGKVLAGATIVLGRTGNKTVTDTLGRFSMKVSRGNTIIVSFVGYREQRIILGTETELNISLTEAPLYLDEVVMIGYGTLKKKDLTGAISSVSEKDFNKGTYTSPDQLIQGKIAGVQVTSNDGSPGAAITIKIRGNSALSGTGQPLYVVDGVPLDGRSLQTDNNPLNFLNPIDIISIDVLKDASATAIYGSRGAYGVVIINTKKGQAGGTKLEVAASSGISSVLKKIKILNATQYREAIQYYGVNSYFDKGGNSDGQDAVLRTASQQNYSIAGTGGNENGSYRFSAGYLNQDGILLNTNFKKYNSDIAANFKLLDNKKLGLDLHVNSSQYIQQGSVLTSGDNATIFFGLISNPTANLRNGDGSIKINPPDGINPLAVAQYVKDNLKVTTILGSISPYYKITDWLEYKFLASINYSAGISRSSKDQALWAYQQFQDGGGGGSAAIANNELVTRQITHTLNFDKEILHGLRLNAVAGYEYMKFTTKGFNLNVRGNGNDGFGSYGIDYTNYIQFSDAQGSRNVGSYLNPLYELNSYFGRMIFNYKEKYLLTATFRADGSTKFGTNNKYGYFPSFAVAWNINKEKFFKSDFINSLKVRGGWGKTGNQEFPPGSSQALYAFQSGGGLSQINNPNPNLKWQSDRQYNIGVDFSILDNRITGTLDYFNKNTTNLLFPSPPIQPAPPSSAIRWINLDGHIVNRGLEISINGAIVKEKDFSWDLSVNASFLHNNVYGLSVPIYTGDVGGNIEVVKNGLPIDAFYTRKFLGLDKSNGQSVYQGGVDSVYYVGNPNPKTLLGISSTFRYKNFSLTANMNGSFGQKLFNASFYANLNVYGIYGNNMAQSVFKNAVKESLVNPSQSPSSRYIENGNYLRMANLTLSYTPGNIANTFKGMTIYITAQNLFLITKYQGFDPEVNVDRNHNGIPSLGIDYMRYPSSRSFIAGINFSL